MTGSDKFFVSVLNAIANGSFFNEGKLWEESGYKKFNFEIMINDIKIGKINVSIFNRTNEPELFKMITKSLALLTMFPHNKENELEKMTKQSIEQLKNTLNKIWGKEVTIDEYHKILNQ